MADRRPAGEREFNPLDDALDLIGRVMGDKGLLHHSKSRAH